MPTAEAIERELGIPIVNKRIFRHPHLPGGAASATGDFAPFARAMDRAAREVGVNFIGGFSALVQKGMTVADRHLIQSIPEALSTTELVCSSVNVGSTKAGINMDARGPHGPHHQGDRGAHRRQGGMGCAKLVVFCKRRGGQSLMAGAFHGAGEPEQVINVGVSGPGVVYHALQEARGKSLDAVAELIKKNRLPHHADGPAGGPGGQPAAAGALRRGGI